ALRHSCIAMNHYVFTQSLLTRPITEERESNSRIASNVFDLLVQSQMAHNEFLAFNADPHYGHLRPAVGMERGQMSEGSFFDQFSYRFGDLHVCLSFSSSGTIDARRLALGHGAELRRAASPRTSSQPVLDTVVVAYTAAEARRARRT